MNRLVGLKQFEITRGALLKFMETLDDKIADTCAPEGFNNTIRWHIGHVLTAARSFHVWKNSNNYQLNIQVCLDMDEDHLNGKQKGNH